MVKSPIGISYDSAYLNPKFYPLYDAEISALENQYGMERTGITSEPDGSETKFTHYYKKNVGQHGKFRKHFPWSFWDSFLKKYPKCQTNRRWK